MNFRISNQSYFSKKVSVMFGQIPFKSPIYKRQILLVTSAFRNEAQRLCVRNVACLSARIFRRKIRCKQTKQRPNGWTKISNVFYTVLAFVVFSLGSIPTQFLFFFFVWVNSVSIILRKFFQFRNWLKSAILFCFFYSANKLKSPMWFYSVFEWKVSVIFVKILIFLNLTFLVRVSF